MKKSIITTFFLLITVFCFAQSNKIEAVDWLHPKIFKAKSFTFKSDSVLFESKNCKIFEIRTLSGITGYFVESDATIQIKTKGLNEKCSAAMFRFNPADVDSLIQIKNLEEIQDDAFFNKSLKVLKSTFRHCYHSGMDAMIPDKEAYAIDFFSPRIGEVLVSHNEKEIIYYNFTLRTKM